MGQVVTAFNSAYQGRPRHNTIARMTQSKTQRLDRAGNWTAAQLAAHLGVSARTVTRRMDAGVLPHIDHGPKLRFITPHVVKLAELYGLRGVENMVRAGKL